MGFKNFSRGQYDAVAHPEKMDSGQISRTRWALAIFIIVLLAGAITLGVLNNQKPGQQDAGPAPVPTIEYTAGPGEPSVECLDNTDKDISATAPKVEQWVIKGNGPVPTVKGAGPCGKPVSGLDTGFAKTQTGALVATMTYGWGITVGIPGPGTLNAVQTVVVPGSARDSIEARIKRINSGAEAPEPDNTSLLKLAGYRVSAQGDTARVDLAFNVRTNSGSQLMASTTQLQWIDNDWKIVPATTEDVTSLASLSTLSGYVPWTSGGTQ